MSVISSVIWYVVLFRQNHTDRPVARRIASLSPSPPSASPPLPTRPNHHESRFQSERSGFRGLHPINPASRREGLATDEQESVFGYPIEFQSCKQAGRSSDTLIDERDNALARVSILQAGGKVFRLWDLQDPSIQMVLN